jgi:hypothetical protein
LIRISGGIQVLAGLIGGNPGVGGLDNNGWLDREYWGDAIAMAGLMAGDAIVGDAMGDATAIANSMREATAISALAVIVYSLTNPNL